MVEMAGIYPPLRRTDCSRLISAALFSSSPPSTAGESISSSEKTWCQYVAGMIGTYLNEPVESDKVKAIAGIIERRLWALPTATQQMAAEIDRLRANQYGSGRMQALRDERDELMEAAQHVHDSFAKDIAQGYKTRDKQFAVDVLGRALKAKLTEPVQAVQELTKEQFSGYFHPRTFTCTCGKVYTTPPQTSLHGTRSKQ